MNRRLLLQLAAAIGLTLASILALAAAARADRAGIVVEGAFARSTIGASRNGVVYLTVRNGADAADRLVGASTPVAQRAELHFHERDGDVLKMRRIEAVVLGARATVAFKPGGMHVMLLGLTAPLKEGESFPLTLEFEASGALTVDVPVKSVAEGATAHQGHGDGQASQ